MDDHFLPEQNEAYFQRKREQEFAAGPILEHVNDFDLSAYDPTEGIPKAVRGPDRPIRPRKGPFQRRGKEVVPDEWSPGEFHDPDNGIEHLEHNSGKYRILRHPAGGTVPYKQGLWMLSKNPSKTEAGYSMKWGTPEELKAHVKDLLDQEGDEPPEEDDDGGGGPPRDTMPKPPAPSPFGKKKEQTPEPEYRMAEGYDDSLTWEENLQRQRLRENDFKPHEDWYPGMSRQDPLEDLDEKIKADKTPRYGLFHNGDDPEDWDILETHHDPEYLKRYAAEHAGKKAFEWDTKGGIHTARTGPDEPGYFIQRDPNQEGGDDDGPHPLINPEPPKGGLELTPPVQPPSKKKQRAQAEPSYRMAEGYDDSLTWEENLKKITNG